jgi:hypothetical protein
LLEKKLDVKAGEHAIRRAPINIRTLARSFVSLAQISLGGSFINRQIDPHGGAPSYFTFDIDGAAVRLHYFLAEITSPRPVPLPEAEGLVVTKSSNIFGSNSGGIPAP